MGCAQPQQMCQSHTHVHRSPCVCPVGDGIGLREASLALRLIEVRVRWVADAVLITCAGTVLHVTYSSVSEALRQRDAVNIAVAGDICILPGEHFPVSSLTPLANPPTMSCNWAQ